MDIFDSYPPTSYALSISNIQNLNFRTLLCVSVYKKSPQHGIMKLQNTFNLNNKLVIIVKYPF
jgi:hypothetical protein